MITLELGLEMEHAALRFWTALADGDLDRLRKARRTASG
jgi:PadR family transcriptional regulator, regulatory protein AphA